MTRWWWFRACNNPSPHENGSLPSATTVEEIKGATSSCVNNSRAHPSSDGLITSSNVLNAAQTLSTCIQQMGNATPAPDPLTASIINTWLDTHLPAFRSYFGGLIFSNVNHGVGFQLERPHS
ncbi:uncharacterized protein DMENIID0001_056020 [Sergentomyia squamirostris]